MYYGTKVSSWEQKTSRSLDLTLKLGPPGACLLRTQTDRTSALQADCLHERKSRYRPAKGVCDYPFATDERISPINLPYWGESKHGLEVSNVNRWTNPHLTIHANCHSKILRPSRVPRLVLGKLALPQALGQAQKLRQLPCCP